MNATIKQIVIWVFLITGLICLWQFIGKSTGSSTTESASYSEVLNKAKGGQVKEVTIEGTTVKGTFTDGTEFRTTIPPDDSLYTALENHGASITVRDQTSNFWVNTLISVAPFALLLVIWFFLLRQIQAKAKAAAPPQNSTL